MHCCVAKSTGSMLGAALGIPPFFHRQLFRGGSAGSRVAGTKLCFPSKGKIASARGGTVTVPLSVDGRTSQLEEQFSSLKERASPGESTGLSSEDYSSGFNPGPHLNEGDEAGDIKRCTECQHTKPLVDFEGTTTSADGRYDVCRACTAASRAKRAGKSLYHLDLSVAESWERAKTCIGCGRVKEARDFGVNRSKKDCLSKYCRGCVSAHQAAKCDREPTDEPQKCWQCGLVKPATDFHANKKSPTGRRRECSQCVNEVTRRLNARRRESRDGAFVRSKKRCTACGEEKTAEHYQRRKGPADGLSYMCKPCTTAYFARWKAQRRSAIEALAEVEVQNSSELPGEKKA